MSQIMLLILLVVGVVGLAFGSIIGYYVRQSIVKKRKGTIEAKLHKKITQTKQESEDLVNKARQDAAKLASDAQKEREERRKELLKTETMLFQREEALDGKVLVFEDKEKEFEAKVEKLKVIKEKIHSLKEDTQVKLEKVAGLSKSEAKEQLLKSVEEHSEADIMQRIQKLNQEGADRYKDRAKEILVNTIQRYALSQAQEVTTTTLQIPSDDVKGRIIGKEGRNIKAFEKATGVDIIVDDTPGAILISGFNPLRRHIAKVALERLIQDGRIQPARIEEIVEKVKEEVDVQLKEFGEKAAVDTGTMGLPPKVIKLLGRLYFRTSYGQNVLLHSIEVAHLAAGLAEELGADAKVARKAGLLHDIGKAVDHQVQGSHVDIGIKILEKFSQEPEVIDAMKAHHEEYEPSSVEAIIVKTADQISGARPGARRDTVENYLNRLKELEDIALEFSGVNTAYAIQAGREIRVFVKPEDVGDLEAYKLAREIADKIQQDLQFPGEIKVNLIRETRVIEYAR